MSQILNPEYKPHAELGFSDANWDTLKATLITFFQTNVANPVVSVADARALDPAFADDKNWAQIVSDMGLFIVP